MSRGEIQVEWCVYGEQREKVESALLRALHYAPSQTESVSIRYDPNEGNLASTTPLPEYRTANIRIGNGIFSETGDERAIAILHEVLHQHIETLAVVFDGLVRATTTEGDALRAWAEETWRRAEEGVIAELSHRIHEREKLIP